MSKKCPGCGFFTLACQCKKDDNYCSGYKRVISDCSCWDHHDHYRYPYANYDDKDNDNGHDSPCNRSDSSGNGNYSSGGNDYSGGNDDGGDDD